MALQDATFPLIPRRRLVGLPFGAMHSARRGAGDDVVGNRRYVSGDDVRAIDWATSARLSSASGSDEFVVREFYADEAPFAVVVCDRRPEMALFPPELPWLHKHDAVRAAAELIGASAVEARGLVGYLDYARGEDEPFWRPPQSQAELWSIRELHLPFPRFDAPPENLSRALAFLGRHSRSVPSGSFVFVLSDFLVPPEREVWARALEHRWDLVPVVIQDPIWEQTFPPVDGVVVPIADARGRMRSVRMRAAEAKRRRAANESRLDRLLTDFVTLGIEPILLSSSDRDEVFASFLAWSDERQFRRGRAS